MNQLRRGIMRYDSWKDSSQNEDQAPRASIFSNSGIRKKKKTRILFQRLSRRCEPRVEPEAKQQINVGIKIDDSSRGG